MTTRFITSIGKLARHLHQIEQSVLLAAGDTFRAAAREQLARWGERNNVQVIANEGGDPAAVAFDAIKAGQARKVDVVMVDTAGRLPTQRHLMDVPQMDARMASEARRFTWLIDVLYDQKVNLIISAEVPPDALYTSGVMAHEFVRTASRLNEMQSDSYRNEARRGQGGRLG